MSPSVPWHSDGSRSRARALGALIGALVTAACRTPPPLVHNAPEPPPLRSETKGQHKAAQPQPQPKPSAAAAAPVASAPTEDPRALETRYAGRPALRVLRGEASYYGAAFAGRKTASGEVFDPRHYTAAHRTLPFGTVLRVTRSDTGAAVYVRVNDRGPYGKARRILDLSSAAAQKLDMLRAGVAEVRADVLEEGPR